VPRARRRGAAAALLLRLRRGGRQARDGRGGGAHPRRGEPRHRGRVRRNPPRCLQAEGDCEVSWLDRLAAEMGVARLRARRRRSAWNLALVPLVMLPCAGLWIATSLGLERLHLALHARPAQGIADIVIHIAPAFASVCPAMLIANQLAYRIRPLRRTFDRE